MGNTIKSQCSKVTSLWAKNPKIKV
jgi:GTPase SAR1 family protein